MDQHGGGRNSTERAVPTERVVARSQRSLRPCAGAPDNDKLVMFDRQREVMLSMAENVAQATGDQLQALLSRIVERVESSDREVGRIVWTPSARPFFAAAEAVTGATRALLWCPQGVSSTLPLSEDDSLAWYVA
ncbi:hypothetical protein BH23CHL9_BH23CHL9_16920 [soil metagenome]|jgi:hypothetical protein